MTLHSVIQYLWDRCPVKWRLLHESFLYWRKLCKYNASVHTDDDMRKMQFTLLRENHVIEKGMSMPTPKKGFGQEKVLALMERLSLYYDRYGKEDFEFLRYPLSTIKEYIIYTRQTGVDIPRIEERFEALLERTGVSKEDICLPAGIVYQSKEEIRDAARGDFRSLMDSRHSIRYFKEGAPSRQVIDEALSIAARTPSACNRQAWHTHVYRNAACHDLLDMQGGCGGFSSEIHCAIVVTADMKGFLKYEPFQCYVDGGLYAMNLTNALHSLGLGTIPLSCGFYESKLSRIRKAFGIPENEVPVVIIGTGELYDSVKIAESRRKDISMTNIYHDEL